VILLNIWNSASTTGASRLYMRYTDPDSYAACWPPSSAFSACSPPSWFTMSAIALSWRVQEIALLGLMVLVLVLVSLVEVGGVVRVRDSKKSLEAPQTHGHHAIIKSRDRAAGTMQGTQCLLE
jgi:hypothetical protein